MRYRTLEQLMEGPTAPLALYLARYQQLMNRVVNEPDPDVRAFLLTICTHTACFMGEQYAR